MSDVSNGFPPGHRTPGRSRTPPILVVEDQPLIARLLQTLLQLEELDVVICRGGREALEVLAAQPVSLIILDIMMPDMDGYEVLRRVRHHPATRGVPVMFLTALSDEADIQKGMQMGADSYMTKPFSGTELVRQVRILLEERRICGRRRAAESRGGSGGAASGALRGLSRDG